MVLWLNRAYLGIALHGKLLMQPRSPELAGTTRKSGHQENEATRDPGTA